jgi:hypothetical protein
VSFDCDGYKKMKKKQQRVDVEVCTSLPTAVLQQKTIEFLRMLSKIGCQVRARCRYASVIPSSGRNGTWSQLQRNDGIVSRRVQNQRTFEQKRKEGENFAVLQAPDIRANEGKAKGRNV